MRNAIVIFAFAGLLSAQTRGASPPNALTRKGGNAPFWVSSAVAIDASGHLNRQVLDASTYEQIERTAAAQHRATSARVKILSTGDGPAPCQHVIVNSHPTAASHRYVSLEQASADAGAVYRGTVHHIEQGFLSGMPASLLEVAITDPIKSSPGFPVSGTVYAAYPVADLEIAGQRVCNAGPNPNFSPHVGDQIVVIAHDRPIDTEGRFLPTGEDQLLFERNRSLVVSSGLRRVIAADLQSLDQIANRLRPAGGARP